MAKSQATYRLRGKKTQSVRFKTSRKMIICGGLLISLLSIAVVYYVKGSSQLPLDKQLSDQVVMKNVSDEAGRKAQVLSEPHFEFYTILPQQKV